MIFPPERFTQIILCFVIAGFRSNGQEGGGRNSFVLII